MQNESIDSVRVLLPLAPGAEDLEAVTIIDLLRRARWQVSVAGLVPGPVTCARGTVIVPDALLDDLRGETFDVIVLPGGLPGANHLRDHVGLRQLLQAQYQKRRWVAALCAAPKALAAAGILEGRRFTAYPGALEGTPFTPSGAAVEVDPPVITGRGPGSAMEFALTLIEQLAGPVARAAVEDPLLCEPARSNRARPTPQRNSPAITRPSASSTA